MTPLALALARGMRGHWHHLHQQLSAAARLEGAVQRPQGHGEQAVGAPQLALLLALLRLVAALARGEGGGGQVLVQAKQARQQALAPMQRRLQWVRVAGGAARASRVEVGGGGEPRACQHPRHLPRDW